MNRPLEIRSRIAPTPSGWLHIGNACAFVWTWLWVKKLGGKLLLRIDDLDEERKRAEYVADIFYTLDWLQIEVDEGPSGPDEFERTYAQRHRMDDYLRALTRLQDQGMVYACTCSRTDIRAIRQDGIYPGTCRNREIPLTQDAAAWRVRVPQHALLRWQDGWMGPQSLRLDQQMGDFVVRRKDGLPAYQVASLVDDGHWHINLVVRGEDLLDSTAAQLFLAPYAGYPAFQSVSFIHHPLITDREGTKLSKSLGGYAVARLRNKGQTSASFYRWLGRRMGLACPVYSPHEMLDYFDPDSFIPRS